MEDTGETSAVKTLVCVCVWGGERINNAKDKIKRNQMGKHLIFTLVHPSGNVSSYAAIYKYFPQ